MLNTIKKAMKKPFNLIGLDITHVKPPENYDWLIKNNIATIFDIGANTGQFATMIHKILPYATIFSFEPIEECYNILTRKMAGIPKSHTFNYALGDINSEMKMHINEFSASSSLLPMTNLCKEAYPFTAKEHVEKVKIRQLDDVAQNLDLEDNLLVKIDVQGYEDMVIKGGRNVISRSKVLIVETNFQTLYFGSPLFEEIYDTLRKIGFKYKGALHQMKSPIDGSVIQADSIFVKNRK